MRQARFPLVLLIFFVSFSLLIINHKPAYADSPYAKLGRGVANLATGWMELPKEMAEQFHDKGEIPGLLAAPFAGIAKAVKRTAIGLYETLTFFIPVPKDYKPMIEPEYVFGKSSGR